MARGRKRISSNRPAPASRTGARSPVAPSIDPRAGASINRPDLRKKEFRIEVRRPTDHLVFWLAFENLTLDPGGALRLVRAKSGSPAYFAAEFPPQHFGEQAYLETTEPEGPSPGEKDFPDRAKAPRNKSTSEDQQERPAGLGSVKLRMAGRSRLVFGMPDDVGSLGYTLAEVLEAMRTWPMRLDPLARPDPSPKKTKAKGPKKKSKTKAPGTNLFRDVAEGMHWNAARTLANAALERYAGTRGLKAVEAAAMRVGGLSVRSLGSRDRAAASGSLDRAVRNELQRIARSFPRLRTGAARAVTERALSLRAGLVISKGLPSIAVADLSHIPYLGLYLSPHKPGPDVTALELPYRLFLTPVEPAHWQHRTDAPESEGRAELWHTRLTAEERFEGVDAPTRFRAIWSDDYSDPDVLDHVSPNQKPFRMSLDALDRKMLVELMAGFQAKDQDGKPYEPLTAGADRLHLTSLGALLDSEGSWGPPRPKDVDLELWRHLAALGRDQYVRVVYAGFLWPFRHAASLIKVTERKFQYLDPEDAGAGRVAVLRQRFFIVVRQRRVAYGATNYDFPFQNVEILTRVTPNLLQPGKDASELTGFNYTGFAKRMAFWPMIGEAGTAADFRFELAATDLSGNRIALAMPLLFIGETIATGTTKASAASTAYTQTPAEPRRKASLGGQSVCYAPLDDDPKTVDTRFPTESVTFEARDPKAGTPKPPNVHPAVQFAKVGVQPLQKMLGKPDAVVEVAFPDAFKSGGITAAENPGQLFLKLTQPLALAFGAEANEAKSDALGALASPRMAIMGLSRLIGPAGASFKPNFAGDVEKALEDVRTNNFRPSDFFPDATILGAVKLIHLLPTDLADLSKKEVPKLFTKEVPGALETRFDFETGLPNSLSPLFLPNVDGKTTKLAMHSVMRTDLLDPTKSDYESTASVDHFKVNLFGFVKVWFDKLEFSARKGQKPDVAVALHGGKEAVEFGGPLQFVNKLREIIPADGFSDPPDISVTPSGIQAGYSMTLPSIGVGIFTLTNVSLGAAFSLPFDSRPASVRFNFSERHSPFSLTVSALGGGGFFAIVVDTHGVEEIEAALEFGAAVAINLGVASGGVEIKAGIYFHWQDSKQEVELAGYVRVHGELSVLGLISASVTFNLQLAYKKDLDANTQKVWGEATLVIEVEVLFFSADVEVRCRREFQGSDNDPKFIHLIPNQSVWDSYCGAFADEGAP